MVYHKKCPLLCYAQRLIFISGRDGITVDMLKIHSKTKDHKC